MDSTNPAPEAIEVPLIGDGVTQGIVRIGDTVHRPVRPFTSTVHAFLTHLHAQGFAGAPLPLGYDDFGREVLTYVAGDVRREPLPDSATTLPVLEELARLVDYCPGNVVFRAGLPAPLIDFDLARPTTQLAVRPQPPWPSGSDEHLPGLNAPGRAACGNLTRVATREDSVSGDRRPAGAPGVSGL
jgi:hypothetical protein